VSSMAQDHIKIFSGGEPTLLANAVSEAIDSAIGAEDRALKLQELSNEDYSMEDLVDAAQTLPLFTQQRVVVARGLNRFKISELGALLAYLENPSPATVLLLEWGSGAVPKKLVEAVSGADGRQIKAGAPAGAKGKREWFDREFEGSGMSFDHYAQKQIVAHLGDDVGRLPGFFEVMRSAFGMGAAISEEDVRPYLGEQGSVPPWELTDAIDSGRLQESMDVLQRMMGAGNRHALQVMASLHNHYEKMLRLDGMGIHDERDAASLLGIKGSAFPAKKALNQLSRLGASNLKQSISLLADADLDLRGRSGLDNETIMEVLVARLARLRTS